MTYRDWHAGVVIEVDVTNMVGEVRLNESYQIHQFDLSNGGLLSWMEGEHFNYHTGAWPHVGHKIRVFFEDNNLNGIILGWVYEDNYDAYVRTRTIVEAPEYPGQRGIHTIGT
ncbi:MAG: hypothetical protein COT89_02430 [Candidatus Colwellbacteria bacterium CG10_big_fil_rev_8_21_14_0_10_42_22]|uniref:Uncharacterized protein n=1 Tax=Candidatus Colwellbacteria bacterium CG10_big_fil_rev_8_21_14_0_10_42_22 TaxID=1974540 RepID=A0A2H0VFL3_9BACT|nr:MAG: hypothetical protein COT89_02430 [Candidatus Colwellbacteria bacterium CG10_big_fil_rev_8_21_14_0_10_42_22]